MKQEQKQSYEMLKEYKDVLTSHDLAKILGCGKNKVNALLKDGTIPSLRIDNDGSSNKGAYRIRKDNLLKYLNNEL